MPSTNAPYGYVIPAGATFTPANPVAPASTSAYKMQGLGAVLTPITPSPKILVNISANLTAGQTTVGTGINLQMWYGPVLSGVGVPANTNAIPSSAVQLGTTSTWETGVTLTTAADSFIPVDLMGLAIGLTPGQQYWFDLAAESITTASQCGLQNVNIVLVEIG